ncbi:MAG: triacylglycerol lipase, partial [Myxococcota bacterium]
RSSAISLATPHYGTPLATFFTSMQGRNLLRFLTVMATSDRGRYSIFAAAQLTRLLARADDRFGRRNTMLDMLANQLLSRLSLNKEDAFWRFLEEIETDQGAIVQLTPEGTNLFNAAVTDDPSIRYGAIVTVAAEPSWKTMTRVHSVDHAARYSVFTLMHRLTQRVHRQYPYPVPNAAELRQIVEAIGTPLSSEANDGVVPSLSQLHGELLAVYPADHLDVVGQFYQADIKPYADWLPSGSGFTSERFEQVWTSAGNFIASSRSERT